MPQENTKHTNGCRNVRQRPYMKNRAKQAEENLTKILNQAIEKVKNPAPCDLPIRGTVHQAAKCFKNNLEYWKNAAAKSTIINYLDLIILIRQEAEKRDPTKEHFQQIYNALQKELQFDSTQWRAMKRVYTLLHTNRTIIDFLEDINISDLWHISDAAAQKLALDINSKLTTTLEHFLN